MRRGGKAVGKWYQVSIMAATLVGWLGWYNYVLACLCVDMPQPMLDLGCYARTNFQCSNDTRSSPSAKYLLVRLVVGLLAAQARAC